MFVQNPKTFEGGGLEWLFDYHLISWLPLFLKLGKNIRILLVIHVSTLVSGAFLGREYYLSKR